MFQFSGLPTLYYFIHITLHSLYSVWVPPFGNLRIYTYLPFPAAYRSLSRPSSAPDAKASSLCSCSLDPFFLGLASPISFLENYMSIQSVKKIYLFNPYEIVFTLFGKTFFIVSLFSLLILFIVQFSMCNCQPLKVNHGGDEESRTPDPLLARQVLSQLSYTPMLWWA